MKVFILLKIVILVRIIIQASDDRGEIFYLYAPVQARTLCLCGFDWALMRNHTCFIFACSCKRRMRGFQSEDGTDDRFQCCN